MVNQASGRPAEPIQLGLLQLGATKGQRRGEEEWN